MPWLSSTLDSSLRKVWCSSDKIRLWLKGRISSLKVLNAGLNDVRAMVGGEHQFYTQMSYGFTSLQQYSVISGRWKGEHERHCAMKRRLGSERISPPARFEPATP